MTRFFLLLCAITGCYERVAPLGTSDGDVRRDAGTPGDASLAPDAGFPPAECGDPGTRLEVPSAVSGVISGFDRMGAAEGAQCWGTDGGEAHYVLHVERRQGVIVRIEGDRTAIALRRGCSAAAEFACAHPSVGMLQAILDPGDYELLLDTWSPETYRYTLTIESFDAVPNSECDGAVEIPRGGLVDQDPSFGGTGGTDTCASSSFPELYYYVDVPPRTAIDLRTTTTSPGDWRAGLRLQNLCRETSEPCEYYSSGTIRDDASFANPSDSPDRLIVIGSVSSIDSTLGRFDIGYDLTPIAAHGTCEGAVVWNGAPRRENGRDAGQRVGRPGFVPDRTYYYRVELPARTKARVRAMPIESDGGSTHVHGSWLSACGDTGVTQAVNDTDSPVTWILEMSFSVADPPRAFEMTLERIALAPNTSCDSATVLAPGRTMGVFELATGGVAESACSGGDGTELWFETTVPAGRSVDLTATLTDFAGTYPFAVIRLVTACGGACEAEAGEASASGPRSTAMTLDNRASAAERTFVYAVSILELGSALEHGTFRLSASTPR